MRVAIIDTETGGLNPETCGLTQIAAIDGVLHASEGKVVFSTAHVFHEVLRPFEGYGYEKSALEYQGLTMNDLLQGSNVCGALTLLSNFMNPIVACGPGRVWAQEDTFDHGFIREALRYESTIGNNDPQVRTWIKPRSDWNCSKRLARLCISLGILNCDSDSLDPVCRHLGIERPTFSNKKPVQDCWMTGQVIASLLTRLGMAGHPYFLER